MRIKRWVAALMIVSTASLNINQSFASTADLNAQIEAAVNAVSADYEQKAQVLKSELQKGIDEGHIDGFEGAINVDIEWGLTSIVFDLPTVKMKLQRWVLDLPSSRMVYKSCIMKIPEFRGIKIYMRCVGMHVPEFFMDRQEFKLHVPEFFMDRVEWKLHVPKITSVDSTIEHKQRLGNDFKNRFADLAVDRMTATRDAIVQVYDNAITAMDAQIASAEAKGANVAQISAGTEVLKAQKAAIVAQMNAEISKLANTLA